MTAMLFLAITFWVALINSNSGLVSRLRTDGIIDQILLGFSVNVINISIHKKILTKKIKKYLFNKEKIFKIICN